jgi:8-oxo-dGTP diphosphatase
MIEVVAGVCSRNSTYLVGLRPSHKRDREVWEFPGGKVEAEETIKDVIEREWKEELGVELTRVTQVLATMKNDAFTIKFIEVGVAQQIQEAIRRRMFRENRK